MIYLHDTFSGQLYQGADSTDVSGGYWDTYNGYTSNGRLILNADQNRFLFGGDEEIPGDIQVTGTVKFDNPDTSMSVELLVGNIYNYAEYYGVTATVLPGSGVSLSAPWLNSTVFFPATSIGVGVDYPFLLVVRHALQLTLTLGGVVYDTGGYRTPGWTHPAVGQPTNQIRLVEGLNIADPPPGVSMDFVMVASIGPSGSGGGPDGVWTNFRLCVEI